MSLISDGQAEQFRELGYFVTEPMWDAPRLDVVAAEFDRLHALAVREAEAAGDAAFAERLRVDGVAVGQAHAKSGVLREFVRSPIYLEACAKLVGPDADLYYNQAVIKPPRTGARLAWHQDSGYLATEPLEYVTCWTAISRASVDNGCVWVIPGSHRGGLLEHRLDPATGQKVPDVGADAQRRALAIEAEPGQVAVFSSLLLHMSGPNTTGQARKSYVPQYHHPHAVGRETGRPWGDRFPVLRSGTRMSGPGVGA